MNVSNALRKHAEAFLFPWSPTAKKYFVRWCGFSRFLSANKITFSVFFLPLQRKSDFTPHKIAWCTTFGHWSAPVYHCECAWLTTFHFWFMIFSPHYPGSDNNIQPHLMINLRICPSSTLYEWNYIRCGCKFAINMSCKRVSAPIFILQTDLIGILEPCEANHQLEMTCYRPANIPWISKFTSFWMHDHKNLLLSSRAKSEIGVHHDQKCHSTRHQSQILILIMCKTVKK